MRQSTVSRGRVHANGEGTISHRKDGRWEARWHVREGGKLVRRSLYAKTKEEAGRKLREELRKADVGMPSPHGPLTVGAFLTQWLEDVTPSIRPTSVRRYTQLVEQHLVPALGDLRLVRLQPDHLQGFYAAKLKEGLSPATVRLAHAVLHRALSRALRSGKVSRNVADAAMVDLPRLPKRDAAFLDPEQTARALTHAGDDDDRLEALWITALMTGMRRGELLALRWDAVDLDRGMIDVRYTLQPDLQLAEPKSDSSRRAVPIAAYVVAALQRHQGRQAEERYLAGNQWREPRLEVAGQKGKALSGGLVFPNPFGRPLPPMVLGRGWSRLLDRSGLPRMPFHSARHTAASLMAEAHTHPKVAAERLGHAKAGMTLDRYTHSSDDQRREAASATERFLGLSS